MTMIFRAFVSDTSVDQYLLTKTERCRWQYRNKTSVKFTDILISRFNYCRAATKHFKMRVGWTLRHIRSSLIVQHPRVMKLVRDVHWMWVRQKWSTKSTRYGVECWIRRHIPTLNGFQFFVKYIFFFLRKMGAAFWLQTRISATVCSIRWLFLAHFSCNPDKFLHENNGFLQTDRFWRRQGGWNRLGRRYPHWLFRKRRLLYVIEQR